ncbi:PDZ domain-containing protein [Dyella sp. C9]|uniref:PDZ domain-containing protein n=1 Tax=Dyella sp. C9 TaxID=2202154 RepID=UPI000DEF2969|nr:PDZ domain-containing protein [Dyella sp. C9]
MRGTTRTLLLLAMLASPAVVLAGHLAYQSDSTLRWHDNGRYLHLAADRQGGVDVLGVTPASLWGLAEGDIIVQADGHPVDNVANLLAALQAHGDAPMPLRLRRGGVERDVTLAVEARALLARPPAPASSSAAAGSTAAATPHRLVFQSDNSLRWRSEGRRLHLVTSRGKDGVDVISVVPAALWGFTKGDEILAANGKPVRSVSELLVQLHGADAAPVALTVRRAGVEQTVQLAEGARELAAATAPPAAAASAPGG